MSWHTAHIYPLLFLGLVVALYTSCITSFIFNTFSLSIKKIGYTSISNTFYLSIQTWTNTIGPFFGTHPNRFSILARILPFTDSRPDSTIFRYSDRFHPLLVLAGTVFRYSYGFYLFPVLAPILSFSGTDRDSSIFRYSFGQFFGTRTDSTFSRYSPGF